MKIRMAMVAAWAASAAVCAAFAATPDSWDARDDAAATATDLAPVFGTGTDTPEELDPDGHGWHRLGETDWYDVFRIAGRKDVTYVLRVTRSPDTAVVNNLAAEVFTLSGSTERAVATTGDINAGSETPLTFTAAAHAVYYVRLSVAEGTGRDCSDYKVHAMAYSATGAALRTITVNTLGTTQGSFSLGTETIRYPGGASVLAAGTQIVKFGAVAGLATPAARTVPVTDGQSVDRIDVYYSDTADPKDDDAKTATAWTLKTAETSFRRTLWPGDPADHFAFAGADGCYYDFALRDATCDASFSITNAELGVVVSGMRNISRIAFPKTKSKYILRVVRGASDAAGGTYTLAGRFANVGAVRFARTAVTAREDAPSVSLTVNRTAKEGMVRVRYATVAGTAEPGVDYVAQSGVLEWAAGDNRAKTITVKLIPDLVATWEGNKTFSVSLEPALGSEYWAQILGGDACTVTLTEVSRAGTTAASTYAAKAPKAATTKTEVGALRGGTFYGIVQAAAGGLTNGLPELASVTLTVSAKGGVDDSSKDTISAKVLLAGKTYAFKTASKEAAWNEEDPQANPKTKTLVLTTKVANVAYANTLELSVFDGSTTDATAWMDALAEVRLTMNVPDANNKGVQRDVVYTGRLYRQNAKIQDYLNAVTNFTGYYTVALAPGAADGAPAGNGYLTLTVDNKGTAKVAGALADGATKPSFSVPACALVPDEASACGYALRVPVFFVKSPQVFGGELRLVSVPAADLPSGAESQVVVDAASPLVWNNDNAAATYDGASGFSLSPVPCGGWYDTVFNLQTYYLGSELSVGTVGVAEFPVEALPAGYQWATAAGPDGFALAFTGNTLTYDKKVLVKQDRLVDLAASTNVCNVAVKLVRATGIYSGTCSLWSENEAGTAQKEITGLKHAGVLLLSCDAQAPLPSDVLGAGFVTQAVKLPSVNPVTGRTTTRAWTFSAPFNICCE
ncbi:MAG: Calx-beta domain-containing protein [Kiritimatiellia bacterium]